MFTTSVFFNDFDLSIIDGVIIYNHDFTQLPTRELKMAKLARADKSVLTSAEYRDKQVTITGVVCGENKSAIEDAYAELKGAVQFADGILRIEQGGNQVEWTGTLNQIEKRFFGKKLMFTMSFICSNPVGIDQATLTPIDVSGSTVETFSTPVAFEGSFKSEPSFQITINSVTDGTDGTISLVNSSTGQGIRINNDFASSDILVINNVTKQVTLNGVVIDYEGQFPYFYPGIRIVQYIDDFTARNVDVQMTYSRQYV